MRAVWSWALSAIVGLPVDSHYAATRCIDIESVNKSTVTAPKSHLALTYVPSHSVTIFEVDELGFIYHC
jgi:hypothetical protein